MPIRGRPAGFTLVELLAVLMIIGILSGVAAPRFYQAISETHVDTTISHLKTITLAAEMHYSDNGGWPDGGLAGEMHADFVGYLRPNLFAVACPIGGVYDWDENENGVTAAIVIEDPTPDRSEWILIDLRLDDGDLTTGSVRANSANRLSWILEP